MSVTSNTSRQPIKRHIISSIFTLSLWRWRQQWFLLMMICLGMIAAITIVCAIPLLSSTMQTAALRNVLRATPESSEISLRAQVAGLSTHSIEQADQASHSARRPLWQRLNLDLFVALIALAGFGITVYLTSVEGLLDPQTQTLVVSPLALLAPVFLLLAIVLLFLRFLPIVLHFASRFVMRGRSAPPVLAVAQMARRPRQRYV